MLEKVVNATSIQLNSSYRCSENSGMVTRHNQSKFDLDYFYSDDYLGEQYVIEISEEEYNRIQSDRFHPVKLMHGSRISVYELQKRFYMKYQDFDGLYVKNVINKAEIEKRIEKVVKILLDNKSTIKLLVICKSEMSMYGNSKVNTYILNRLYDLLEGQIDLLL